MLTQEQKEFRKTGIGGSDASAIAGHNKYKTNVDVYLNKVGEKEEKELTGFEDYRCDPRYWGHIQEPIVAQHYEIFEGRKVEIEPRLLRHPKYTWMIANIDRRIAGENAILECKTASEFKFKEWGEEYTDNFPDEYLFQCMHYAIVDDASYVDCAVLIGGNKFKCYRYERNKEAEELLIELEHDFWHNHVIPIIPPEIKTYEQACKLWRKQTPTSKTLPSGLWDHLESYRFVTNKIKEYQEQADFDKAKICEFLADSSILLSPLGMPLATWKEQAMEILDRQQLKKDYPDIYQQYIKTSTSRVFRLKEIKS